MEASDYIISVAIPTPVRGHFSGLFTYRIREELLPTLKVGGWVTVPFGVSNRLTHAFVTEAPKSISELDPTIPLEKLKDVIEVGDPAKAIPEDVFALCRWAHEYYGSPLGEVLNCAIPAAALKPATKPKVKSAPQSEGKTHVLSEDQNAAVAELERVRKSGVTVGLLQGVTGSGKTEVYLALARKVIEEGKSVLVLVPEIALTSQLFHRFEKGLGVSTGLWHSAVADGKRQTLYDAVQRGEIRVLIGVRSAVFAPLQNLGLIVIDEEHDATYKQEERVRYHARDLAIVRATKTRAFVVLGSATPSFETRERVREGKYGAAYLRKRIAEGGLPSIDIVDLETEERVENTQAFIAKRTITAIQKTLLEGNQVIVFLNRRGFAAFLICKDCRQVHECPNCSISLSVHRKQSRLRCHVCDHEAPIPDFCPKCLGRNLQAVGAGTESLEEDLPKLIPEMIPLRLDRDQITSVTRLEKILSDFREHKANVLLGTQMLVKGHDFPDVTLVVVILADALFRWPDFRAPERAYQILKQVAGRAGRGVRPGRVLIQTFGSTHPVIQTIQGSLDETIFLEGERELRKALGYPPFGRLARLRFESTSQKGAMIAAKNVAQGIRQLSDMGDKIELLGPSEAFLERAKNIYRWDLLIKASEIQHLRKAISFAQHFHKSQPAHSAPTPKSTKSTKAAGSSGRSANFSKSSCHLLVDVDPYGI